METRYFHILFTNKSTLPSVRLAMHGDGLALEELAPALNDAAIRYLGTCKPVSVTLPAALLLPLDIQAKPEAQEAMLSGLAAYALELVPQRGQSCQVAAFPIFLVLVHAERLV